MSYTSDSYTNLTAPEKSIYPPDARIFHQAGYAYDTVETLSDIVIEETRLSATAHLRSGQALH